MRTRSLPWLMLALPLLLTVPACGRTATTMASVPDEAPAQVSAPRRGAQLLVKFKAPMRGPELLAFNQLYGTRQIDWIPTLGIYVLEVPADQSADKVLGAIRCSGYVEYAELNETMSLRP